MRSSWPRILTTKSSSDRIAHRLSREAAVKVEHPFAPAGDWVVWFEELERARRARPLESAEHGVVGVGRAGAAEEYLGPKRQPQRREQCPAKLHHCFVPICAEFLEGGAHALFTRLAEVRFVLPKSSPLHRRYQREATRCVGWTKESRRHCGAQCLGAAAVVEAGRMGRPSSAN